MTSGCIVCRGGTEPESHCCTVTLAQKPHSGDVPCLQRPLETGMTRIKGDLAILPS